MVGMAGLAPARELSTGFQNQTAAIYGPTPRKMERYSGFAPEPLLWKRSMLLLNTSASWSERWELHPYSNVGNVLYCCYTTLA